MAYQFNGHYKARKYVKIIADQYIPFVSQYFANYGELILKDGRHLSAQDVKDADLLFLRSVTKINKDLLAGSNVKFIGSIAAGTDHIDTEWLKAANIAYATAAGFNAPPVADYVISCVAAMQKSLSNPSQLRAAVIGVGNTGKLVVERLKQLQFTVLTCDPLRAAAESDFISTPLSDIENCDLISLHVPLTKKGDYPTWRFINKQFLTRQKPNCILLNTSRGDVLDYDDLKQHGKHLQWCFDVWQNEPNIDESLLAEVMIATPHIAGHTVQSKRRGVEMIYQAACKQGFLEAKEINLPSLSLQNLALSGDKHHWQAVLLAIFNPILLTATMRSQLLSRENVGVAFDEMRNNFQFRNEFAYIKVDKKHIYPDEIALLRGLGVHVV